MFTNFTGSGRKPEQSDIQPATEPAPRQAVQAPVWQSLVSNSAFQEAHRPGIRAEQQRISENAAVNRSIDRQNRQAAAAAARAAAKPDRWKAGVGTLEVTRGDGTVERYDPESVLDDPEAGPHAATALFKRDAIAARDERDAIRLRLQDPRLKGRRLSDHERQKIEAEGSVLAETDPNHAALKKRLIDDDAAKADEQAEYDAEVKYQTITKGGVPGWLERRRNGVPLEQRKQQAMAQEAQLQDEDTKAAAEEGAIRERMAKGMTLEEMAQADKDLAAIKEKRAGIKTAKEAPAAELAKVAEQAKQALTGDTRPARTPERQKLLDSVFSTVAGDGRASESAMESVGDDAGWGASRAFEKTWDAIRGTGAAAFEGWRDLKNDPEATDEDMVQRRAQADVFDSVLGGQDLREAYKDASARAESFKGKDQGGIKAEMQVRAKALGDLIREFEKQGITDGKEMTAAVTDAAKANIWAKGEERMTRTLSDGSLAINPALVSMRDGTAAFASIDASDASPAEKERAKGVLSQARQQAATRLAQELIGHDEGDFKAHVAKKQAEGVSNIEEVLYSWDGLDSGFWSKSGAFIRKVSMETLRGIESAARGGLAFAAEGAAASSELAGADDLAKWWSKGTARQAEEMRQNRLQSEYVSALDAAAGENQGAVGVAADLGSTVGQMAPMFVAGPAARVAGLGEAGAAAGVYGWAGLQGASSIIDTALQKAETDAATRGAKLTPEEMAATVRGAMPAAIANGVQTAVLSKLMGGGAERAALGKAGADEFTLRNLATKVFKERGPNGLRGLLKELKPELKAMVKTIKADATDESIEEATNQFLEGVITQATVNPDKKVEDIVNETMVSYLMAGPIGGALPQLRKGGATGDTAAPNPNAGTSSTPPAAGGAPGAESGANAPAAPAPADTTPEATATVNTAMTAADPRSQEATPEEVGAAQDLVGGLGDATPEQIGEAIPLVRELAALDEEAAQGVADAEQALIEAQATGEKGAATAAETVLEQVRTRPAQVQRARGVVKLARGAPLSTLNDGELRSLGITREGKPLGKADLEANGLTKPLVELGEDGSPIILDEARAAVAKVSPTAADRIGMTEAQARAKATQRAAEAAQAEIQAKEQAKAAKEAEKAAKKAEKQASRPTPEPGGGAPDPASAGQGAGRVFTVTSRSGATVEVQAANETDAMEQGALAFEQGDQVAGVVEKVAEEPAPTSELPAPIGENTAPKGEQRAPKPEKPARKPESSAPDRKAVATAVRKRVGLAKKRLKGRLNVTQEGRVKAHGKGIDINPEALADDAAKAGLNPEQADKWVGDVIDEEVRHHAHLQAAADQFRRKGLKGNFDKWLESHYGAMWREDFTEEQREAARRLYGSDEWDAKDKDGKPLMPDWKKAMEALRMISQELANGSPTEAVKLWTRLTDRVRQAIKDALRVLREMSGSLSDTLKAEVDAIAAKLKEIEAETADARIGSRVVFPYEGLETTGTVVQVSPKGKLLVKMGDGRKALIDPDDVIRSFNAEQEETAAPPPAWYQLSADDREALYDLLDAKLKKRGTITFADIPAEFSNQIGTSEAATIKAAIERDPAAAIAALRQEQEDQSHPFDMAGEALGDGWFKFSGESGTLGIPRDNMPQIKAEDRSALVQFLRARGIDYVETEVLPGGLKPSQAEFSAEKVDKARAHEGGDRALLVSEDMHLVDGHHQWLAKWFDDPQTPMRVITLKAPINEVLAAVREFPSVELADQGSTTSPVADQKAPEVSDKPEKAPKPKAEKKPKAEEPQPEQWSDFQKEYSKLKGALTKAKKGTPEELLAEAQRGLDRFEATGMWPDDWSAWERAKEDAQAAIERAKNPPGSGLKDLVPKPARSEAEQALIDLMGDLVDGLEAAPLDEAADYTRALPPEKMAGLFAVAQKFMAEGVDTPEAFAAVLSKGNLTRLRPYSQALWGGFIMANPKVSPGPDWAGIYAEIDNAEEQEQGEADESERRGSGRGAADTGSEEPTGEGPGESDLPDDGGRPGSEEGSGSGEQRPGQRGGSRGGKRGGGRSRKGAGGAGETDVQAGEGDSGSGKPDRGAAGDPQPRVKRPEPGTPEANFVIEDDFRMPSGPKARIDANLAAIRLLRTIEAEERNATAAEKETLSKYSGWGSFKNAFNQVNQTRWNRLQDRLQALGSNQRHYLENSDEYRELSAWRERWGALHDQLTELLEPEEFRAMSKSIMNAHYTSLPIIDAMWRLVDRLGFNGGKVLETSAGGGYFVGRQPKALADRSAWSAIELDEITARIFSKLYPEARINGNQPAPDRKVNGQGFQDSSIPNNSVDLIIGNFPFDDVGPSEAAKEFGMKMNLHNYFFARSLDKIRPGGLVVAITSASTMDNNLVQRELLAGKAELVGAIRLPNTAFKDSAGTEVTTDILILRKKDGSRDTASDPWIHTARVGRDTVKAKQRDEQLHDWLSSIPAEWIPEDPLLREAWADWRTSRPKQGERWKALQEALKATGYRKDDGIMFSAPMEVNAYFANHPEMALGKHALAGTMYSAGEYALIPGDTDLMTALDEAIAKLPEKVFGENVEAELEKMETKEAEAGDRPGSTVLRDGKVYQVLDGQLVPVRWDVDVLDDIIDGHAILKGNKKLRDEFDNARAENSTEDFDKWMRNLIKQKLPPAELEKLEKRVKDTVERRMKLFTSWVKVRDAARGLVDAELSGASDEKTEAKREALNDAYDDHVRKFGPFNKRGQNPHRFLDDDEDTPLLESLEDEELTGTDAKGKPQYRYVKRPIFSKAQLSKMGAPETAEDIKDAVGISLGYMGRLSVPYMAKLLNVPENEVVSMLGEEGLAFVNPKTGLYETADSYLSGEVRTKLREAEQADAESGGQYSRNIEHLNKVMPPLRPIHNISVIMGARWLPGEVYTKFAQDVLGLSGVQISYQPAANLWRIQDGGSSRRLGYTAQSDTSGEVWSTNRMSAGELIDAVLNKRPIAIYDTSRDSRIFNSEATLEAQAKAEQITEKFNEWLKTTEDTIEIDGKESKVGAAAERLYNENVAGVLPPTFKGDWITLPGQSGEIWLKDHRRAVLARMLTLQYGMMAHGVGSGKTYNQIALAMELRRLGKARKVLTLVQNSTIKQFAASHMKAYPHARILVADEKNFTARKRAKFLARIVTGDYDSIILTHSNVALIGHDEQAIRNYMARAFDQLNAALADAEDGSSEQRDIQKAIDKLQEKLDKMLSDATKRAKSLLTWEQLGIDALIVDEAHAFKNAPIVTRMARVKNLPNGDGSNQAIMMQMKVANVQANTGGKNIFFATGTPITNTMAEAYTMLQFIAPQVLEHRGIKNFDDFATTFGRTVAEPESTWKGEIENVERFAKFINGPELVNLIRSVFDVAIGNESLGIRVPRIRGGGPRAVMIEPTEASEIFNDWIIDTAAAFASIPNKKKTFEENPWMSAIPIMVMQAGMAQAVDPRLINPNVPDDPDSKVNKVVDEVVRIYKAGEKNKTAQVIFSDLSNPFSTLLLRQFNGDPFEEYGSVSNRMEELESAIMAFPSAGEMTDEQKKQKQRLVNEYMKLVEQGFNLFDDIKKKLVAKGIPASEIAIASSDMDRKKLQAAFEKVNSGQIRVIMGSTARLGVGVNIQERLAGLHNISPPRDFKPAMMEQRIGRIERQGNLHRDWADTAFILAVEKYGKVKFTKEKLSDRFKEAEKWLDEHDTKEDLPIRQLAEEAAEEFAVDVLNYGLKLSMDSAVYSMMKAKQGFIEQVLMGENVLDEFDDPASEEAAGFALMAAEAMGNEDLKRSVTLGSEIQKLGARRNAHNREAWEKQSKLESARHSIEYNSKKDPAAIRAAGKEFEGVFSRVQREMKTTKGAIAKEEGREISEEEAKEPATRKVDAAVYRFGDQEIDTGKADAKIVEPLTRFLVDIHADAVEAGKNKRRDLFVNGVRFEVETTYAKDIENATIRVYWPQKFPGGDTLWESSHKANGMSLLATLRKLTEPGYTDKYARSIEWQIAHATKEAAAMEQAVQNQKPFPDEEQYREKMAELQEVNRRLREADTNPRNHRYYRALRRIVGEEKADAILELDGKGVVPTLPPETWNKIAIRLRFSQRTSGTNATPTPTNIVNFARRTVMGDAAAAAVEPETGEGGEIPGGLNAAPLTASSDEWKAMTPAERKAYLQERKRTGQPIGAEVERLLTDSERKEAAAILGDAKWTGETRKKFTARMADWLVSGKEASARLAAMFNKVARGAISTVLAGAVALSFTTTKTTAITRIPVREVAMEAPALPVATRPIIKDAPPSRLALPKPRLQLGSSVSADTATMAQWVVDRADAEGMPFAIADKKAGRIAFFDARGRLTHEAAALFGKSIGDIDPGVDIDKARGNAAANVTPAGRFPSKATPSAKYGQTIDFAESGDAVVAIHRVFTGRPAENRPGRLASESPLDNRISLGCINVSNETADEAIPTFKGGGVVYVMPETEDGKGTFEGFKGLNAAPLTDTAEDGFYSALARTIEAKLPKTATPEQALAIVRTGKAEELKWTGIEQAIPRIAAENGGKVPKAALLDYLRADGAVVLKEVTLGTKVKPSILVEDGGFSLYDGDEFVEWYETRAEAEANIGNLVAVQGPDAPKYAGYKTPGGENYREVVLAMPHAPHTRAKFTATKITERGGQTQWQIFANGEPYGTEWGATADEAIEQVIGQGAGEAIRPKSDYTSSHFSDVPNYVAHMRLQDFGDGTLIEEIQSDRHQKGRKDGYKEDGPQFSKQDYKPHEVFDAIQQDAYQWFFIDKRGKRQAVGKGVVDGKAEAADYLHRIVTREEAENAQEHHFGSINKVSDAPFRKDWPIQLFKRALRDAVEQGKAWIGWTTGATQGERFDLSKQVDGIRVWKTTSGKFDVKLLPKGRKEWENSGAGILTEDKLADTIGKDLARKAIEHLSSEDNHFAEYTGDGLKTEAAGMKGFYDKILPSEIGKYVKQWGGKVEKGGLSEPVGFDVVDNGKKLATYDHETRARELAERWRDHNEHLYPNAQVVPATSEQVWRVQITPAMRDGVKGGQPLFAAPLSSDESEIDRLEAIGRKQLDPQRQKEAEEQQREFAGMGKVIGRPDRANPGSTDKARDFVDTIDEMEKFVAERETVDQWNEEGSRLFKEERAKVERKWLTNAFDPQRSYGMMPEDVVAAMKVVDDLAKKAGNSIEDHVKAGIFTLGYRKVRATMARVLAAGFDRFQKPEERYRNILANTIYAVDQKVVDDITKRSRNPEEAVRKVEEKLKERLTNVTRALKKMGVTIEELLGGQVFLSLSQKRIFKDAVADLSQAEKLAIRVLQKGGTMDDARKLSGLTEQKVEKLNKDLRQKLKDQLRAKVAAGAKLEDLRDEIKALHAAPLDDSDIEAELERIITLGFGLPAEIPRHKLPKRQKKVAKESDSPEDEAQRVIDRWLDVLEERRVNPKEAKAKDTPEIAALIKRHLQKRVFNFEKQAIELGATPEQAEQLSKEAELERARRAARKAAKPAKERKKANAISIDWNRTEIRDGMDGFDFDPGDRHEVMRNLVALREIVGIEGAIEKLPPEKRGKALRLLADINKVLKNYGTNAEQLAAGFDVEDFKFDITDRAHVMAAVRAIRALDADAIDKASEWAYSAMLSGPQTNEVNLLGGAFYSLWDMTFGRAFEAGLNLILRDPKLATFGEFPFLLKAMKPAITRAWSNMMSAWATETPFFEEDVLGKGFDPDAYIEGRGMYRTGSIAGTKGRIIRMPMRALLAADEFVRTVNAVSEVGAMAHRLAQTQGLKPGQAGYDTFMKKQVNIPGSPAWQMAAHKATERIFAQQYPGQKDVITGERVPIKDAGDVAAAGVGMLNKALTMPVDNKAVKAAQMALRLSFFPFQKIPFNILRTGMRYVPANPVSLLDIGLLAAHNIGKGEDGKWTMNKAGGKAELVERVAKQIQGAVLMSLLGAGLGEGDDDDLDKWLVITGSRPWRSTKAGERDLSYRQGMGPTTVSWKRADGSRGHISYGRWEPLATQLATTIDTLRELKAAHRGRQTYEDARKAMQSALVSQVSDKSFFKGLSDLKNLIFGESDINRFAAERMVSLAIPNLIRQPVRESDPVFREKGDGFTEQLLAAAYPQGLPAKHNVYGEKQEKDTALEGGWGSLQRIFDFTDAGATKKAKPYDDMLLKYQQQHPAKAWAPGPAESSYKDPTTGKETKMNAKQAAFFHEKAGKIVLANLSRETFNLKNPTEADIKKFQNTVDNARSTTRKALANSTAFRNLK